MRWSAPEWKWQVAQAVRPSLPREDVLKNAPDQRDGMFRVKAIFEE